MKPFLDVCIYFSALLLISYYFVGVSLIKSTQMAALITILYILILFIERYYKRGQIR
ncbi:hypothetical protein J45TS6_46810 [Paenibacillus sp. J45TS6]|nr:hypothetical protein J45TS6_46810 [Paenibacillus sp. J45TS6]